MDDEHSMTCPGCGQTGDRPPPASIVRCPLCQTWMRAVRAPGIFGERVGEVELAALRAQQEAGARFAATVGRLPTRKLRSLS